MNDVNVGERTRVDFVALVAIALTILGHVVFQASGPNPVYIGAAGLFWAGFITWHALRNPSVLRRWGFRFDNLGEASAAPALIAIVLAALFAAFAYARGQLHFDPRMLLLMLGYMAWGLLQQFLVLGIIVRNLMLLIRSRPRDWIVAITLASIFGLVHLGDPPVAAGVFVLQLTIIMLYLRHGNLWPLGALHGWTATLFYYLVLGRDLWQENFGAFLALGFSL